MSEMSTIWATPGLIMMLLGDIFAVIAIVCAALYGLGTQRLWWSPGVREIGKSAVIVSAFGLTGLLTKRFVMGAVAIPNGFILGWSDWQVALCLLLATAITLAMSILVMAHSQLHPPAVQGTNRDELSISI